jgi:hypothetical protein
VALSFYKDDYSNVPAATSQINIKIVSANIVISRVGTEKDFFVELSNNTGYDADISNWILASAQKNFIIPRNTVLQTKNKMIISPKITGFSVTDKDTLKLINSEGDVIFDYSNPTVSDVRLPQKNSVSDVGIPQDGSPTSGRNSSYNTTRNLSATAFSPIDTEEADSQNDNSNSNAFYRLIAIFSFVIFLGISALAVYFIRRKKILPPIGNDFEILDE